MSLNLSRWLLPVLLLLTVTGLVISPAMAQDEVADDPPAAADAEPADEPDAAPVGEDPVADPDVAPDAEEPAAEEEPAAVNPMDLIPIGQANQFTVNNLWIMIAGMLVFIMHLGFATLESGLTRSKNTVNILFKNTMIICIGLLTYGVIGFNLMYPTFGEGDSGYFKFAGFDFLSNGTEKLDDGSFTGPAYSPGYTAHTDFFFQAMFAATCATIVSGAVAGRIKLSSFLIFSTLFVSLNYPITGSWKWGGGWLDQAGFYDFAGSTLVPSVGGWGALVMAILLGPRKGKYVDGRVQAIPASNLPLAAMGVFLLWFGWFGFNGGSVLSADPGLVSLVLVTTSMAAAAGGFTAAIISWTFAGKPDLTMALNGILAGLVGITAGADQMSGLDAIIIGIIAGVLVYFAVIFIDSKLKIDDPVGAVSVHLVCGIWGTLAVGLFGASAGGEQLMAQIKGIVAIGIFTVVFVGVVGVILKSTIGLRVDPEEEDKGLDIAEHGMEAYHVV
jgi:Amt family ammonium transporter